MKFAEKLTKLIVAKGVSNYRVAKDLDMSQTTIANYLSGKNIPNTPILSSIAKYFGVSIEWLVNDKAGMEQSPYKSDVMFSLVNEKIEKYNANHKPEIDNIQKLIEEKDKRIQTLERLVEFLEAENKRLRDVRTS